MSDDIIYELKPGLERCGHLMRYTRNQCQLAKGHILRHAWEPSNVERIAAIERATDKESRNPKTQNGGKDSHNQRL